MNMFATGNGQGQAQGFFCGHYGGPRANNSLEGRTTYNFMKTDKDLAGEAKSSEPLNEEILDGCAHLLDLTGKRVQIVLHDGRILIGELASVDHFSNLVLRDAVERIIVGKEYGDIVRGVYVIRGDNLVLIGEIDTEKDGETERGLQLVSTDEILLARKYKEDQEHVKQMQYREALKLRAVSFPRPLEDDF